MPRWGYDDTSKRYRNLDTGRYLSAASEQPVRDDFLAKRHAQVADLAASVSAGDLSVQDWERQMQRQIQQTQGVQYAFGRGGRRQVTEQEWSDLADVVQAQHVYLRGFASALQAGDLSEAQIAMRSSLYVDAANTSYSRAQAASYGELDLPVHPGEDCDGLTNCRCRWSIQDDGDAWSCVWVADGDANTCEPCTAHADEWAPLVIPKETAVAA